MSSTIVQKIWNFCNTLRDDGVSYGDYLEEKEQKLKEQKEKAKRDDLHKDLQIQDLVTKLNVMNEAQLSFWDSQTKRGKKTSRLARVAISLSIITLLKSFGFFDWIWNALGLHL